MHRQFGLAVAATTALLLQACAEKPGRSGPRIFDADMAGGAKTLHVPKIAPAAGRRTTSVEVKLGNDGGWCAITVNNGGKPYAAGLLSTPPAHGKVLIHTVGNDTRIDYTPDRALCRCGCVQRAS